MRNQISTMLLVAATLCGALTATVGAADPAAPAAAASPSADEQALRAAIAAYRKALHDKDINAVDALWIAEGDYVDQLGRVYHTHDALERAQKLFQEEVNLAHLSPEMETVTIRFITPDVAIEDGDFERGGAEAKLSPHGRYTTVWVKRDGKWLIDGIRESPIRAGIAVEPLKGLSWMIGEWAADAPQGHVDINCTWGPDKSCILSQLKIQPKEGKGIEATQLIGWDAGEQRVRSLMFDSRGGFTEGIWSHDGEAWVVRTTGVLPDGRKASSTKIYSHMDDNTLMWESIDDEVEGQPGLDMRLKVTRKPQK